MGGQSAFQFLITTLFDLYLMVVLLRIWLQMASADFYNPLSQFVVKATHPIVGPLRRIMPSVGSVDTASLLLAFIVVCTKFVLLLLLAGVSLDPIAILFSGCLNLFKEIFNLIFWVLILRAIMSWVVQGYNPIAAVLAQLSEPILAPVRRVIPPIGGLDLSVLVVLIALQFLQILLMPSGF